MGWYIENYAGNEIIFHGGILNGFTSCMAFSRKHKLGLIILTNSNKSPLPQKIKSYFFNSILELSNINSDSLTICQENR